MAPLIFKTKLDAGPAEDIVRAAMEPESAEPPVFSAAQTAAIGEALGTIRAQIEDAFQWRVDALRRQIAALEATVEAAVRQLKEASNAD